MNKEVRFDIYCSYCKHASRAAAEDPCNSCLGNPSNEGSHKPQFFDKEYPMVNYLKPDPNVPCYTVDRLASANWKDHQPNAIELKTYFEKKENDDWWERWDMRPVSNDEEEEE